MLLLFTADKEISNWGLQMSWAADGLGLVAAVVLMVTPILFFGAKKGKNWAVYPQLRTPTWNRSLLLKNQVTWVIYLTGYEFFFRGYILFSVYEPMGFWGAIWLTTLIYVCVHLPKNVYETIGCIPIGLLFGYVTLQTNSIVPAVLSHVWIACTNDLVSFRANPHFSFRSRSVASHS
jgi:membrane protease YdiL (CAAX protease family)